MKLKLKITTKTKIIMRKIKKDHVLILRINDENNRSNKGRFQYPSEIGAWVEASDFINNKECGNGLHGLLKGCQDVDYLYDIDNNETLWMLLEVHKDDVIDLNGKIKFKGGYIYFVGEKEKAIDLLYQHYGNIGIHFAKATSGDGGTSTSGDGGTSTSGDNGTSTSGKGGTSTSGYGGTSTSGNNGTSTSGKGGTSTSGYGGTSTSGDRGTSISGYEGTSTSGDRGTSISGDRGTSISGDYGISTSGYGGTSISGDEGTSISEDNGTIIIKYLDGTRYRFKIGYIGEDGLKPNTPYQLNMNNEFEEAISN